MSHPQRRSPILLDDTGAFIHSPFNRLLGRTIDTLIAVAIYFLGNALLPQLGTGAALLFTAFGDAMSSGQSFGKRLVGLQVVEETNGLPCSPKDSFLRNVPFCLAVLFAALPGVWFFNALIVLPILCVETYLLFTLDTGCRVGDVLANTRVLERHEIPTTDAAPGPL